MTQASETPNTKPSKQMRPWNLTEDPSRPDHWKIRVYAGLSLDGHQTARTKSFIAHGETAAMKRAALEAAKIEQELAVVNNAKDDVTRLVTQYIKGRKLKDSPSTIVRRETIAKRVIADLGTIPLSRLTAKHLDGWYDKLRADTKMVKGVRVPARSESTVHHYHRVFAAMLNQGERWGMLGLVNPLDRTTPPKRRGKRPPVLPTMEQLIAMRDEATPGLWLAILLAIATGLRRGELLGFRYSDIVGTKLKVERVVIEVPYKDPIVRPKLKHDKPRWITIDPHTVEAVAGYREMYGSPNPDAYILADFQDPSGCTPRRPGWLSLAWSRLADKHGVGETRLHDLRHLSGSILDDAGVRMAVISARFGHGKLSTTQDIYTHAAAGRDEQAALILGEAMGPLYGTGALPAFLAAMPKLPARPQPVRRRTVIVRAHTKAA